MNKLSLPALVAAAAFTTSAFAHDGWDGDDRWQRRHRHRAEHVVVHHVYDEPAVVYEPAPVVYRERIVYRERPVYYEAPPRDDERPAVYVGGGNRLVGQALGAIAGGALGSQVGKGNGRIAATAIGAVVGGVLGGNAAGY